MSCRQRRWWALSLALVGLGGLAWWRRRSVPSPAPAPVPVPLVHRPPASAPPAPAPVDEPAPAPPSWVPPVDRSCPESHPVKANDDSGIFHVPGGLSYARTIPERCYDCAESAAADGYRAAKR